MGSMLKILGRVSEGRGQDALCQMVEDPGLTAEERGPGPAPLGAPTPILLDDDSGDARRCHEEEARAQPGNGASAVGARALERRRSSLGWKGGLPGSSPPRGLRRLSGCLTVRAAAGVAVAAAAAARQLELGSRPAGGSQEAGDRGSGGRRGRRHARTGGARRGRRAGRRAGRARGGPRGNPDEPVVDGEQHGGQRDAEEVGADRGEAQPAAPRAFAQPGATRALAAAAHAARAPHPRSPLGPAQQPAQAPPPRPGPPPPPTPSEDRLRVLNLPRPTPPPPAWSRPPNGRVSIGSGSTPSPVSSQPSSS